MVQDKGVPVLHFSTVALLFFVYVAITVAVSSRQMVPTGDEPHYLVITHSLVIDRDISLLNNYQNQEYRVFYPGLVAKRTTASADKTRELPTFAPGLPAFLAPFYSLAFHYFPSRLVLFLRLIVCVVTALALYLLVSFAFSLNRSAGSNLAVLAGAALSSPLITYSSQFYPEVFAFLLLVITLRQFYKLSQGNFSFSSYSFHSLIPGAIIWLHPKYLALALLIFALSWYYLHRFYRSHSTRKYLVIQALYVFLALAGILSFFFFLHYEYGSWSPNRIYGGWKKQVTILELLRQEGFTRFWVMLRMFFGFWIDQRFGILPYAPLYAAFFPALVWALKKERAKALPPAILFVFHFLFLCWGAPLGGFAPPSRHFVVMIPFLALAIMLIFPHWRPWQKVLFIFFEFVGCVIGFLMLTHYRMIFTDVTWRKPDGFSPLWQWLHLERWIPSLTATEPQYGVIVLWVFGVAFLALLLFPRESR